MIYYCNLEAFWDQKKKKKLKGGNGIRTTKVVLWEKKTFSRRKILNIFKVMNFDKNK